MNLRLLIISALTLTASVSNAQIITGLTAAYSFDSGNATDDNGSNDATVFGAIPSTDRFGNVNHAYHFVDGDYMTLPNATELKSPSMTVSLWVKIEGNATSNMSLNTIYNVINSTTNAYFASFGMFYNTGNSLYNSVVQDNGSEQVVNTSVDAGTGNWQHFVLTSDFDNVKMYLDGILKSTVAKGFVTDYSADLIYIGSSGNSTYTGGLVGSVDDLNVFDRVLTDAEVLEMYNAEDPMTAGLNKISNDFKPLSVSPNPTSSELTISVKEATSISIVNVVGEEMLNKSILSSELINVSLFEAGIFFVKDLNTGNTVKFVKK